METNDIIVRTEDSTIIKEGTIVKLLDKDDEDDIVIESLNGVPYDSGYALEYFRPIHDFSNPNWCIRGSSELFNYLVKTIHLPRPQFGMDEESFYYIAYDGHWKQFPYQQANNIRNQIYLTEYLYHIKEQAQRMKLPAKWCIRLTKYNLDELNELRRLYGTYKDPITEIHHFHYFTNDKEGILVGNKYAKGVEITIEQFKQSINPNNKQNENRNIEIQRNIEPIRSTTSGCTIRTQSRNCTITTANGYVANKVSIKRSKTTIVSY